MNVRQTEKPNCKLCHANPRRRKEIFAHKYSLQRAFFPRPVFIVDGDATRQPGGPPAVRASRHDDMLAGGDDGEVHSSRERRHESHVDALWHRSRQFGQAAATPVDVVAGDHELNALESIDEVAHCAGEVVLVRRRVAELLLVVVEHVASTHVYCHAHVSARPARRS